MTSFSAADLEQLKVHVNPIVRQLVVEVVALREKYGETSTLYQDEMAAHAHLSDQIEVERARATKLEKALARVARGEAEVRGLDTKLYGHAIMIASRALGCECPHPVIHRAGCFLSDETETDV
jgi:hypothetical protein